MEIQTGQAVGHTAPPPQVTPSSSAAPLQVNPAAGTVPPPQAGGVVPPGQTWTSSLNDEFKAYVDSKGFKEPVQVLESYRNLEKLMGVPKDRLVKLPEKSDDPAWGDVYKQLGRPDKPEDYGIKPVEGQPGSKEMAEWASKSFHELGVSRGQAEKLLGKWNEFQKAAVENQTQSQNQAQEMQRASLRKEWGAALEENVKAAIKAAEGLGLDDAAVNKVAGALGVDRTMKLLHSIGSKMGEDAFVTGDKGTGFRGAMTPGAAQARINELKGDKAFTKRYLDGDRQAREEMAKLHEWAHHD